MIARVKIKNKIFRVKDCRGLSSVRGLMFDDMKNKDGALIYSNSIWMPFVKTKLNLVFLDENMRVVGNEIAIPLSLSFKSWKTYKNEKAKYCLELKDMKLKVKNKSKIIFLK